MELLVLDLDGTITKSDNIIRFSSYMLFKRKQFKFFIFYLLVLFLKLKIIDNKKLKILYSSLILKNVDTAYLKNCVSKFIALESFKKDVNKDVLEFISKYDNAEKVILSANFSFLVEPISKYLNIQDHISIIVETELNHFTGEIVGFIPFGEEKIDALKNYIGVTKYDKYIGLGDSKTDIPLLKFLDEGYLVKCNKKNGLTEFSTV